MSQHLADSGALKQTFQVREASLQEIVIVAAQVPELNRVNTEDALRLRMHGKHQLLLVAESGTTILGFKIGYALNKHQFYSWIGGVRPEFRQQGVAGALRQYQERWATQQLFSEIHVKSMNRFPVMLSMLINNGYHISGYDDLGTPQTSKIHFVKELA